MRTLPSYKLATHTENNPIILAGIPQNLTGDVLLANPGDQKVVLRGARIRRLPAKPKGSAEVEVPMVAIMRPGTDARARVRLRLDPATDPGIFPTTLVIGEHAYPAELHVAENVDLEIIPSDLVIENRPGSRTVKSVTFRNLGNVDLRIGSPGPVVLDEQLMSCRILRGGLSEGAEDDAGNIDQWLTAFLREANRNVKQAGMLYVRNQEKETIVKKGTSTLVNFLIRQPDTLISTTRYFAVAFFYMANLSITLAPGGADPPEYGDLAQRKNTPEKSPVAKTERPRSAK